MIDDLLPQSRSVTGAAGEYYVMSRLLLMGITACLAPVGAAGVDIVVTNPSGTSLAALQIKSKIGRPNGPWRLGPKAEKLISDGLFYCFVGFDSTGAHAKVTELLVVPSVIVADHVRLLHADWLRTPGRGGKPHNESTVRLFDPKPRPVALEGNLYGPGWTERFSENWDPILELVAI